MITFCSVRRATICPTTLTTPVTSDGLASGAPTFTTMATSAPQRSRTSATGTLSTRPPSTSLRPSWITGAMTPGTAMLARIAAARLPVLSATRSPVPMSVAMSESGSGRSSMSRSPGSARTSSLKKRLNFSPATAPSRKRSPSLVTPNSRPE